MAQSSDFIEDRLIWAILRDIIFLQKFGAEIVPELFQKLQHRYTCALSRDYFFKYSTLLPLDVFEYSIDEDIQQEKITQGEGKIIFNYFKQLITKDYSAQLQYIRDEFISWYDKRNKELVLRNANRLYQEGKLEEVDKYLQQALHKPSQSGGFYNYFGKTEILNRIYGFNSTSNRVCPTCIGNLDEYLSEGGLAEGELGIVLAPTGRGKSIALVHLAKVAIIHGFKPYVVSLEMVIEKKLARRMDSTLIGEVYKTIYDNKQSTHERLLRKAKMFGESLVFKQYLAHQCTATNLRSDLAQLKYLQSPPDVLIIDYADLMEPTRHYNQRYEELQRISEELRAIGVEYEIPVWSASQTNKEGLTKVNVTLAEISQSFGKAMTADVVIALCQTPGEKAENKMRVGVAKNRDDQSEAVIDIISDFTRMQFALS